jgi:hypothetical protein
MSNRRKLKPPARSNWRDRVMTLPEPYDSIIDATCEADRVYFEQHPTETVYYREIVPGEFADTPAAGLVEVTRVALGVRLRKVWCPDVRAN